MAFVEKRKKRFRDRHDGHIVKDVPSLNIIMSALYPNRCDTEVSTTLSYDITNLLEFIKTKNEENNGNLKFFHCFITALTRVLNERRKLLRFVQGARIYERDEITISFVVKQKFSDNGKESLVTYKAKKEDNVFSVSNYILGKVENERNESNENSGKDITKSVDKFAKLPRWLLVLITKIVRRLDYKGRLPKSLMVGDPAFSTVLVANLGSIKCPSCYHHLNNYGSCSIVMTIGTIYEKQINGEIRSFVDVTSTIDERIADGFYFAKSLTLLGNILNNPEILEKEFDLECENYEN